MIVIKNFSVAEFDSQGEPGTGKNMRVSTLIKLEAARELYGKPVKIRHGFRTVKAAERIRRSYPGAVKNSAHEGGYAVDLCPASEFKTIEDWLVFLEALWNAGFRRFGIMQNTIHTDDDPKRASPAIWNYSSTSPNVWAVCRGWFDGKIKNG
jgi:hypothetical protein